MGRYFGDLLGSAHEVLYPAATQLHAQKNAAGLRRLYLDGSRMLLLVAVVLAIVSGIWAEDFYRLWVGYETVGSHGIHMAAVLFRILGAAVALSALSGPSGQMLLGSRQVKPLALLVFSLGLVNVLAGLVLVQFFGLVGVAAGTLLAAGIHKGILIPWVTCRQLGLPFQTFLVQTCARPVLVGFVVAGVSLAIHESFVTESWFQLIAQGAVATIIGGTIAALLGTSASERNQLLHRLFPALAAPRGATGNSGPSQASRAASGGSFTFPEIRQTGVQLREAASAGFTAPGITDARAPACESDA
jgi:O-antigen/teichoic acid export membrane protein